MYGKGQQILMFEEGIIKVDSITDNHILLAKNCARKVTAIRTAKNFNQVFLTLEVTHQLMYQFNVIHKASSFATCIRPHNSGDSKLRAKDTNTVLQGIKTKARMGEKPKDGSFRGKWRD